MKKGKKSLAQTRINWKWEGIGGGGGGGSKDDLIRTFDTGATRDTDSGKHDPEGYFSPLVEKRFCEYMTKHRTQSDGTQRASDNWQKGIPKDEYVKSLLRHVQDVRLEHDGYESREGLEDALCGVIFNAQGYLFELLVSGELRRPVAGDPDFS